MSRYALISVSDKTGIDILAQDLVNLGFEIISTGGTASFLKDRGITTIPIQNWTGFPEIMDGRVKTLHPNVHGSILADLDVADHLHAMQELSLKPIELVVVNLYPFEQTVANPISTEAEIIENIDIGGPALIRSAAKNFRHVTILTAAADYAAALAELKGLGKTSLELRRELASKAFEHVMHYDVAIAAWFRQSSKKIPAPTDELQMQALDLHIPLAQTTRYGENPHQKAGYFSHNKSSWNCIHGKELSYNNLLDLDAALRAILLFDQPAVMIFKHTNPCGIGVDTNLSLAYQKAFETDPLSPYGGIIVVNRSLDISAVQAINEIFSEIIIAPAFEPDALEILKKRKDRRLVQFDPDSLRQQKAPYEVKGIISGYLVQEWDDAINQETGWHVVTEKQPSADELEALHFAWKTVSILKSNAIAITAKDRTLGLGSGQTSRVDSTEIALRKAQQFKHDLKGAVCASDGFFPFRDSVDLLLRHGISAVIQPGGSKGDDEVIKACNELGISMVMTGMRHFRH